MASVVAVVMAAPGRMIAARRLMLRTLAER
jgi:hypothetical protein